MIVFTIGYEGLDTGTFLSLLSAHGIETVVDVRELPLSRKPGFAKKALSNLLSLSGLEYVHLPELGCPKPIRDRYREDGNWSRYTEAFAKHLKRQTGTVASLASLASSSTCALLCFEADANFCHRSMVAGALKETCGAGIRHIRAASKANRAAASRLVAA